MSNSDPSYVRLATRLQQGSQTDVYGSGWSISGLDVRKFPEDMKAARYVRSLLNSGHLEGCSKAEWDEAHDTSVEDEVLAQNPDYREKASGVQEGRLQRTSAAASARLQERLGADPNAEFEAALEADRIDREERLAAQEEEGLNTTDPEEQIARTTGQKKSKAKGKTAKRASTTE